MRSREEQREQKTPQGTCLQEEAVKPPGPAKGLSSSPTQGGASPCGSQGNSLMEQAVARDNMRAALKRVEENKGASGIDKVQVNPEFDT